MPLTSQQRFAALIAELGHGGIARIERRSGIHRSTIERKRDGKSPVTPWDVWALERFVQLDETS